LVILSAVFIEAKKQLSAEACVVHRREVNFLMSSIRKMIRPVDVLQVAKRFGRDVWWIRSEQKEPGVDLKTIPM
jgi:predicted NAD-dependent protein-ADP-ribosyltransferase YbiA (DUF1768 family)